MAQTPPQSRPAVQAQAGLAPAVLDLAEEVLLQELFSRCCSHGKDRAPTPAYCPTAVRGFGPARRGSAVPMLQEDVARFRSRLRKEGSRGGFVFSAFAAHALEAGARLVPDEISWAGCSTSRHAAAEPTTVTRLKSRVSSIYVFISYRGIL